MSQRERRDILTLANTATAIEATLITLVRTSGSSYRRPGARLLALSNGAFAGTISGGCLEADLLRKASWKTRAGAIMEHYSTAFDDTAEVPYGLGCGGEVDLLLEPLNTAEGRALIAAMDRSQQGETLLLATQLPQNGRTFARVVVDADGDVTFASDHLPTEEIVAMRAHLRSSPMQEHFFLEELAPPQRLILFGGGEDAKPLVRLAHELGWNTVVVDRRPQHARLERFPLAHRVVTTAPQIQPSDCIVLMTHSYDEDRRLLTELLQLKVQYLGLLGARHRSSLLLIEASEAANLSLAEACNRLHAPVGLDLGGDGPEAVALAIVAEIQTVLHGRREDPRSLTEGTVREQILAHGIHRVPVVCPTV